MAVGIITVVTIFLAVTVNQFVVARSVMLEDTHKLYLAEEGHEAIRHVRDDNWEELAALDLGELHYLAFATSTLSVTSTPEVIDGTYTRSFRLTELYRDDSGDIVSATSSGATVDPDGRVVTVLVADARGTSTLQSILADIFSE